MPIKNGLNEIILSLIARAVPDAIVNIEVMVSVNSVNIHLWKLSSL
jgi:hypothetical protein